MTTSQGDHHTLARVRLTEHENYHEEGIFLFRF
jgi:hypothetical protein